MKKLSLSLLLNLLFAFALFGQFGQNKVQYKSFDWYYIQTNHFDIYFTEAGRKAAEFTSKSAEEALAQIEDDLDYQINNRVSLIVYNSHNDFQETNTADAYLSQGVGGFTEPFKNRVVFPFEGSYSKFEHVIHHELVHAVIRDKIYGGTVQNIISKGITLQLPHWYHEGMAEYLSSGWETNTDQFIRDAIINEYLPDISRLYGYYGYRGGQAVMRYISETYGREKLGEILNKTQDHGSLDAGLKASIGLSLKELNERWKKDLKKTFWPEIAYRDDPETFAKRLTNNKESIGFYNTSPAISPQGDKIAFISDRDIYLEVYIMNAFDGKIIKKVVESGRTANFEELNVLFPAITWAPDNKRIALTSKSNGKDVISIINTENGDDYAIPFTLEGIESISWSPDGSKLAFTGASAKQSDIYVWDFDERELINVTKDIFTDGDPAWGPEGERIFFTSDRGEYLTNEMTGEDFDIRYHDFNQRDLYYVNYKVGEIVRLTDWALSQEISPVVSPTGEEILFVSDLNGIDNIYKKRVVISDEDSVESILELPAVPITNSLNGLNQLSLSKDGKKMVFTTLFNSGYNIFMMNNPFSEELEIEELTPTQYMANLIKESENFHLASGDIISESFDSSKIFLADSRLTFTTSKKDSVEETGNNSASDSNETIDDEDGTEESIIYTGQYVAEEEKDSTKKDYSNYIFGGNELSNSDRYGMKRDEKLFTEQLDTNGNYLVNRYKISFSPDLIYANAGYSTFYGLLGTTVLSFSDVLGNHRLIGVTSLQVDLKNSDYGLAYYYLPQRINYGIEAFHTARFVYLSNFNRRELFRFRNYGAVASASYPLNRFYRMEGSLSYLNVSSENLDFPLDPIEKISYVIPSVSFIHDNTMFGYTSPIQGSRYRLNLFGNPGLSNDTQSFYSLTWDYRKYFRFWFDNSFAFRLSGGYSGGANPQRFFLGGTENWINRSFQTGDIPLDDPSDFAFLSPALPMRGYDYAERIGSKYSLMNLELRMPLIRYLVTGPLPLLFQNILGTAFIDMGAAWNNTESLQLFSRNQNNAVVSKDMLIGTGVGARAYILFFLLRFDVAWAYDMQSFSTPKYYFSLGLDF